MNERFGEELRTGLSLLSLSLAKEIAGLRTETSSDWTLYLIRLVKRSKFVVFSSGAEIDLVVWSRFQLKRTKESFVLFEFWFSFDREWKYQRPRLRQISSKRRREKKRTNSVARRHFRSIISLQCESNRNRRKRNSLVSSTLFLLAQTSAESSSDLFHRTIRLNVKRMIRRQKSVASQCRSPMFCRLAFSTKSTLLSEKLVWRTDKSESFVDRIFWWPHLQFVVSLARKVRSIGDDLFRARSASLIKRRRKMKIQSSVELFISTTSQSTVRAGKKKERKIIFLSKLVRY